MAFLIKALVIEEMSREIKAQADKEATIIAAEAFRKSQELRGQGDAEAIRIYAQAYDQDPEYAVYVVSVDEGGCVLSASSGSGASSTV